LGRWASGYARINGVNTPLPEPRVNRQNPLIGMKHPLAVSDLEPTVTFPALGEPQSGEDTTLEKRAYPLNFRENSLQDRHGFSPVETRAMQKTEVALAPMVAEIIREFGPETFRRNIVWRVHALPVLQTDRASLQLVMSRLIASGVKLAGTRVESKIEVGWLSEVINETVIFIQENGPGFDARFAGKLFKIFHRRHGLSELAESGIGSPVIQRMIEHLGGRTWATGMVDLGSTFYFSIPRHERAAQCFTSPALPHPAR